MRSGQALTDITDVTPELEDDRERGVARPWLADEGSLRDQTQQLQGDAGFPEHKHVHTNQQIN